jgi:hypothetical protein
MMKWKWMWKKKLYKQFRPKQAAHCLMALPNVIWPWSIYYSKGQLLKKENKKSLGVLYFPKLNIQN